MMRTPPIILLQTVPSPCSAPRLAASNRITLILHRKGPALCMIDIDSSHAELRKLKQ